MNENKILKIATFSLLCYLIFRMSHFILTSLLLWGNLKFQISNEFVLIILYVTISGVIPTIIFIIYTSNSIIKSTILTFKKISCLFLISIIIALIREGINIYLIEYQQSLELGEFKEIYLNQYAWSKGMLYMIFSFIVLVFFMRKMGSSEKAGLESQSKIIKIGISSVLCYLVFEKSYLIMISLLTWLYTLLKIESELIIICFNILFCITSILILISMYNQIIKNKTPSKKDIYILLIVGVCFVFLASVNNWLFAKYIVQTDLGTYNYKYLFQFNWSTKLNLITKFLGVAYFIWKLYSDKKTVGNNV